MPSKIYSCSLFGLEAYGVEIEVDILRGLPRFTVVGLGDAAVQEAKERVRSAIMNSGGEFPRQRKVVNLAPADTKKCGPSFDLPIAVGLLVESGQLKPSKTEGSLFVGELALDGSLRSTNGILACALFAKKHGFKKIYIPSINAKEAQLGTDLTVYPVDRLGQLIEHLKGNDMISPLKHVLSPCTQKPLPDFTGLRMIKGGNLALRALSIASAGGHHVLMSGPPGSGKTLIAQYLPIFLPDLSSEECIELTKIYSSSGLLPQGNTLLSKRPFRSIHHTASAVSLVGGGRPIRPGEISLAHRGVLFLDEIAEFPRYLLETLRQPLEERTVTIARASGTVVFPAHFILVGAMNPCPCGYFGHPQRSCSCSSQAIQQYQKRLSGPLLDRFDLFVSMKPLTFEQMQGTESFHFFETLYDQVLSARRIQKDRFFCATRLNSDMNLQQLEAFCSLDFECLKILKKSMSELQLSARGYSRVLKVARTIADMSGEKTIQKSHLLEALAYRSN